MLDDLGIEPGKPQAGFDTLVMTGTGRWNGTSGATITVTVTDNGEPGRRDTIELIVLNPLGIAVYEEEFLTGRNHQAHDEAA